MTNRTLRSLTAGAFLLAAPVAAHAQGDEDAPVSDKPAAEKPAAEKPATSDSAPTDQPSGTTASGHTEAKVDLTALPTAPAKAAEPASEGLTFKVNDWSFGVYGFAALNLIHDSTQSFGPAAGNTILQRVGTYRGNNNQLQLTARDSRFGFKIGAPATDWIKTSAQLEADFSGTQPTESSEQTTYITNPLRMRHYFIKAETPVVDVLAGQYHDLFGWGGKGFYPATLAFLGVTGEVYHRQPQLRLSHNFASDAVDFEIAVAAVRPVAKGSGTPDVEAGLRLAINGWKGMGQQGYGQPQLQALQIGVSGIGRRFEVAQFIEFPQQANVIYGGGIALNAFIPVVPAKSATERSNALSITAEYSRGKGIADMYNQDLTGGALFPTLPNPQNRQEPANPPPIYSPNIDSGIVTYDGNGKLRAIEWQAFLVGLQYYLPIAGGKVWVTGNFGKLKSPNIVKLTPIAGQTAVYKDAQYVDGNLFVALTSSLQVGYSFQMVEQTFGDNGKAHNYRNEGAIHFFF